MVLGCSCTQRCLREKCARVGRISQNFAEFRNCIPAKLVEVWQESRHGHCPILHARRTLLMHCVHSSQCVAHHCLLSFLSTMTEHDSRSHHQVSKQKSLRSQKKLTMCLDAILEAFIQKIVHQLQHNDQRPTCNGRAC